MVDLFVGRQPELQRSLDLLAAKGEGVVLDIVGVRGVGKTSFLKRLSDLASQQELPGQEIRVRQFDMQIDGLGVGFLPGDMGTNASMDIVREVFTTTSQKLMAHVAKNQHEFDDFRLLSHRLWLEVNSTYAPKAEVTIGSRSTVGKADIRVVQSDAAFRQHIWALQNRLDNEFVKAWEEFTARRRVLITVDTFQLAADNELGQWFIRMARRLRNTLTVFARTPSDIPLWPDGADAGPMQLPFFTPEEITDYLGRRLGTQSPFRELARIAHDFTDGHPGGVNLVTELIISKGGAGVRPAELRRMLDGMRGEGNQNWAALVVEILQAVHRDDLMRAVDAAAVAGIFDSGLLAELVAPEHPQEVVVASIIEKLSGLGMLHRVPAPSGGPSAKFRLHEFIRQSVALRLQANAPAEWQRLQSGAAEHYFRRLEEWETEPYDSYGAWYRYEDLRWQEYKQEWLRHSGLGPDMAFVTRARFTLVFLEAFWWWGSYLPFPFMRRLLDDWARVLAEWARTQAADVVSSRRQEDDQVLLTALTELVNGYPGGYGKPRTSPWDAIRDILIEIRTLCGLTADGGLSPAVRRRATAQQQAEIIRVNAYITVFLAHSRRFRDPADPSAERLYEVALAAFRELEDEWTSAWLVFERADLALERGDLQRSAERLAEGAGLAKELAVASGEWDRELLANLHRAWADVCWLSGRLDESGRHYGWGAANAYWFHGEPTAVDGEVHGPDLYTQQFYREMTCRPAERVVELADRPAQLERFVREMLRVVPGDSAQVPAADLAAATISELQEKLFPPGPADGEENELRRLDAPFMRRWRAFYQDRQDPLIGLEELIHASLAGPARPLHRDGP